MDTDEEELPVGPEHRLVEEAEHGMAPMYQMCLGRREQTEADFLRFYRQKVRQLQDEAGDKDHAPISGNLYMYRALAAFGDTSELFQSKASPLMMVGLTFVIIVQIVGPLCILFYAYNRMEFGHNGSYFGCYELTRYEKGSNEYGLSHIAQRFLGVLFLVLFTLNGAYAIRSDREETKKLVNMCKIFARAAEASSYKKPLVSWLWAGAVINSLCLILCSFCMCFLFVIAEDGPKDVMFDAFGLTFLYNLDDVGGDLGFLDEKWDGEQLGDIYGALADETTIMKEMDEERRNEWTPDNIYHFFEVVVYVLIFLLPLMLLFVEMRPKPGGGGRRLGA